MEQTNATPDVTPSPSLPTTTPSDGRKRPRTPAQLAATEKMKEARKQKLSNPLVDRIEKDYLVTEYMTQKEKRRKQKQEDMEKLISTKLEAQEERWASFIKSPIEKLIKEYLNEEEAEPLLQEATPPQEKPSGDVPEKKADGGGGGKPTEKASKYSKYF
jgi:predicted ATPase with chaperone activity